MNLHTARLILAPHTTDDFADLAAMWADPAIVGQIPLPPSTPVQSWSRLLRYAGLWPLLGFGYWAVRHRASGRFVGDFGFADFHRPLTPPIGDVPEAGWVLAAWAQGQGYAREAMDAALAWLDPRATCSVCLISPANHRSLRLAAALGYRVTATPHLNDAPTHLLTRPAATPPTPR